MQWGLIVIKRQNGDTIVEVLIAMAVASSILALTYTTMNRNLLITQTAQERTEATKLAQGQLESLKAVTDTTVPASTKFCFSTTGVLTSGFSPSIPTDSLDADDFTGYPGACNQESIYYIAIKRTATKSYTIYVRWDRVDGGARDQVVMAYRTVK